MMRRAVAPLCAAAWFAVAIPSRAQGGDKAGAVLLYDEAARLTAAGKLNEACAKYAESHRLDPQLGTLLHLGDCYEKNGQTASAWATFREATELAGNRGDAREKVARKRAAALESHVPKLLIDVPKSMQTIGARIERDGSAVGAGAWGIAVPTDPGAHIVAASASGRAPWSESVTLTGNGVVKVSIPELAPLNDAPPSSGSAPTLVASSPGASPQSGGNQPDTVQSSSGNGQRIAGFSLIGLGAVGAGVGTVFALKFNNRNNAAKDICSGKESNCPQEQNDQANELRDEAKRAEVGAIVGFAVGGAALVTGLVLVLTATENKPGVALSPSFSSDGGGCVLSGRF